MDCYTGMCYFVFWRRLNSKSIHCPQQNKMYQNNIRTVILARNRTSSLDIHIWHAKLLKIAQVLKFKANCSARTVSYWTWIWAKHACISHMNGQANHFWISRDEIHILSVDSVNKSCKIYSKIFFGNFSHVVYAMMKTTLFLLNTIYFKMSVSSRLYMKYRLLLHLSISY